MLTAVAFRIGCIQTNYETIRSHFCKQLFQQWHYIVKHKIKEATEPKGVVHSDGPKYSYWYLGDIGSLPNVASLHYMLKMHFPENSSED